MAAITQQLVADYRDQRSATRSVRTGKPLSSNTVRLELALLSHLFTVAVQEWGIGLAHNPVAMVRKPKPPQGRDRRISVQEQSRLLAECTRHSNPMLYWIVALAIETGMRRGEIVALRRGQVDLQRRIIRLSETKNGDARSVPLAKRAVHVLQEAHSHPIRPIDTDLVFWGEARDRATGERKPYDFTEAWESARTRAQAQAYIDARLTDGLRAATIQG